MTSGLYTKTEEHKKHLGDARRGKIFSKEWRKHLSEAHIGKNVGTKNPMFGTTGSKSPNWKGGITPTNTLIRTSLEYRLWHKIILERDNFTCKKCSQHGEDLVVHHINNFSEFPEIRFAIDNGITLCDKCHRKFHKIFGENNNTQEQLDEFLEEKDEQEL